jgi:hypothetical protein
LISREYAKQIRYPVGITCDQGYLYIKASQKNAFAFSPDNKIIYRPFETLTDWYNLNHRIVSEGYSLHKLFGENIPQMYSPPFEYMKRGTISQLKKDPFFTTLALGICYGFKLIRPFQKPTVTGLWPTLTSTKTAIKAHANRKRQIFTRRLPLEFTNPLFISTTWFHIRQFSFHLHSFHIVLKNGLIRF